jgi:hypothetical protein
MTINCCDFCSTERECALHWMRWRAEYGRTRDGKFIDPPPGWRILPIGTRIPNSRHRQFSQGPEQRGAWGRELSGVTTMTPITAHPSGWVRAYAVPAAAAAHTVDDHHGIWERAR